MMMESHSVLRLGISFNSEQKTNSCLILWFYLKKKEEERIEQDYKQTRVL